jgi:hypothetical protein
VAEPSSPRPLPGDHSRLYRIGVMLLNGYGYNWYRLDNRLRADDLLIRSRAGEYLEAAIAKLHEIEGGYRRRYLPPPTRAHPDADPQHLAAARQFQGVAARVREVETGVRGAAVPPNDKVWQRHRSELDNLQRLGECDALLVAAAKELDDLVAGLPAEAALDPAAEREIEQHLEGLRTILSRRGDILAIAV